MSASDGKTASAATFGFDYADGFNCRQCVACDSDE